MHLWNVFGHTVTFMFGASDLRKTTFQTAGQKIALHSNRHTFFRFLPPPLPITFSSTGIILAKEGKEAAYLP